MQELFVLNTTIKSVEIYMIYYRTNSNKESVS